MTAKLFSKFGSMKGKSFDLSEEQIIGRAKTSEILLSHKLVSNRHARIYRDLDQGCFIVEDLESLNGTVLDGALIEKPRRLGHLHLLNFGGSADFFFIDPTKIPAGRVIRLQPAPNVENQSKQVSDPKDEKRKTFIGKDFVPTPAIFSAANKPSESAVKAPISDEKNSTLMGEKPAVVPNVLMEKLKNAGNDNAAVEDANQSSSFVLTIKDLQGSRLMFCLVEGENLVGRGEGVQVRIVDSQMSRHHAIITVREGRVFIRDLGSTNHSYVGKKVVEQEMEIKPGGKLAFGKIKGNIELRNA